MIPKEADEDIFVDGGFATADNAVVNIPEGLGGKVDKFLHYFQTAGREKFELYLSRSGKYATMMKDILGNYGLPGDLIYLALIESGFSPKAYSVANASGPWQFIAATGQRYGLKIDWWRDERRDFEKSTHAAANYLKDLYGLFDKWPLATAAYNAGEGKIMKAVSRYRSEEFSDLIRYGYLKQETKDYVPKMIAALMIGKEPEKYGFGGVQYEDPLKFDWIEIPGGTDLATLGRVIGVPYETLRELNPELRRFCTPPTDPSYYLRVPAGYGEVIADTRDEIIRETKVTFLSHSPKKGETLASLAERYATTPAILKELNGLKRDTIGKSTKLIVPVTGLPSDEAVPGKEVSPDQLKMAHMKVEEGVTKRGTRKSSDTEGATVKVSKGDTLGRIAKENGVTVAELAEVNGLGDGAKLKVGQKLKLPKVDEGDDETSELIARLQQADAKTKAKAKAKVASAPKKKKEVRHVVRKGETVEKIARFYGVQVDDLSVRNKLPPGKGIRQGRVLFIPAKS